MLLRKLLLSVDVLNYRKMTDATWQSLTDRLDSLTTEHQICRRKLESKCEALLILSRELDQCRSERDQFKLMAEQLRDRYQMVKRQLTGDTPLSPSQLGIDPKSYTDTQAQSLARLLFDTKEHNKSLRFEADDLKQKLQDAEGDIKLLREQIARSRVGTSDEGMNTRHFPAHEREDLVKQLETSREEFVQLERDLQQVLDEKEELVTERDAYRTKYERLNTELNYILRGDEKRIVDIDALSMENKFLQERLKQMEEEKTMAIATVTKYKSILEKKKTKGILKLGQTRSGGLVITQKQVHQIMQSRSSIAPTPQALADLQGLCAALLDTINDKNLAISHQRKTNKILGNRVNELEKKLKTLEVSGLWSVSGNMPNLEKLKAECEEIKTLVPRQFSQSTDTSEQAPDASDFDSDLSSSVANSATTSPARKSLAVSGLSRVDLEELDLLPTKEEVVKGSTNSTGETSATNPNADAFAKAASSIAAPGLTSLSTPGDGAAVSVAAAGNSCGLLSDFMNNAMASTTNAAEATVSLLNENRTSLLLDELNTSLDAQLFTLTQKSDNGAKEKQDLKVELSDEGNKNYDNDQGDYDFDDEYDGDDISEEIDEDEDDESCDEASEEFRNLMDCVTKKLLQQSHQCQHNFSQNKHRFLQQIAGQDDRENSSGTFVVNNQVASVDASEVILSSTLEQDQKLKDDGGERNSESSEVTLHEQLLKESSPSEEEKCSVVDC